MNDKAKNFYREVFKFHQWLSAECTALERELKQLNVVEDVADFDLVCAKVNDLLQDAAKQTRALGRYSTKITCLVWQRNALETNNFDPIRTDYVTASPDVVQMPKVPSHRQDPEAYATLCRSLGMPDEAIEDRTIQPHWPSLLEKVRKAMRQGLAPPAGLDPNVSFPEYSVRRLTRGKKEILDD